MVIKNSNNNIDSTDLNIISISNSGKKKSLKDISADVDVLNTQLLSLKNEFSNAKDEFYKIKEELKDVKKEQDNNRISVIESLGIFIALFTFISIEFQVFSYYRNPLAIAGLSLILLSSIGFLMSLFDFFILYRKSELSDLTQGEVKNKTKKFLSSIRGQLLYLEIIFLILGIGLFSISKIEKFEDESKRIEDSLTETINTRLDNNTYLQDYIEKSKKNEKTLECLKNRKYIDQNCF